MKRALEQVKAVYPGLNVEYVRGGLRIHPGAPAIPELAGAAIDVEPEPEEPTPARPGRAWIRPEGGIAPFEADKVVGRTLREDGERGTTLTWEALA